jgi:hypothetical protein
MNAKELRWEVFCLVADKYYYITDTKNDDRLLATGDVVKNTDVENYDRDDIFFSSEEEAQEFIDEMVLESPEKMYRRQAVTFLTDEQVDDIVESYFSAVIDTIVRTLMEAGQVFSRHDVLKSIRQIWGPDAEVEYSDWKDNIVESIESMVDVYDYEQAFDTGHFVYSPIVEEVEEEDADDTADTADTADTDTVDSATTTTVTQDATPEPVKDTSEPDVVSNRHTISAKFVRAAGGSPGTTMDVLVCKGKIFVDACPATNEQDRINAGSPNILLHTTLKVDKNCNLRISKYMFDLAGLGKWFGKPMTLISNVK